MHHDLRDKVLDETRAPMRPLTLVGVPTIERQLPSCPVQYRPTGRFRQDVSRIPVRRTPRFISAFVSSGLEIHIMMRRK